MDFRFIPLRMNGCPGGLQGEVFSNSAPDWHRMKKFRAVESKIRINGARLFF